MTKRDWFQRYVYAVKQKMQLFSHLFTVLPDAADERGKNTGLGAFFFTTSHTIRHTILKMKSFTCIILIWIDANEQDSSSPPKRRAESLSHMNHILLAVPITKDPLHSPKA
jgi:hypothetical protein